MEEKFDSFLKKLENMFSKWVEEFENRPMATSLKLLLILYMVKWVRRNLL